MEIFTLSATEKQVLKQEVSDVREFNAGRPLDPEVLGQIVAARLGVGRTLTGLMRASTMDALCVENLPAPKDSFDAEVYSATLGFLGQFGNPYQWAEQSPELFQHIKPNPKAPPQSNGSVEDFKGHTDDGCVPHLVRPEILALVGVHNDARAETGVVSAKKISESLPDRLREKARSPVFSIRAPASFKLGNYVAERCAILEPHRYGDGVRMPTYNTFPTDPTDQDAIATVQTIKAIVDENVQWALIEPGTALLVNNFLCLHTRKAIVGDRHVVRAYWGRGVPLLRSDQPGLSRDIFSVRKLLGVEPFQMLEAA
jgi:Taurine catabolism dioxygenase TauD, TfdA family